MSIEKMKEVRGIGDDKAVCVAAAFELGRKIFRPKKIAIAEGQSLLQMLFTIL